MLAAHVTHVLFHAVCTQMRFVLVPVVDGLAAMFADERSWRIVGMVSAHVPCEIRTIRQRLVTGETDVADTLVCDTNMLRELRRCDETALTLCTPERMVLQVKHALVQLCLCFEREFHVAHRARVPLVGVVSGCVASAFVPL